jgi:hypothetical protein
MTEDMSAIIPAALITTAAVMKQINAINPVANHLFRVTGTVTWLLADDPGVGVNFRSRPVTSAFSMALIELVVFIVLFFGLLALLWFLLVCAQAFI